MARLAVSRGNLIFIAFVLLCTAAVVAVVLVDRSKSLEYTILFDSAQDLDAGAPVKLHGIEIGKVTGVRLSNEHPGMAEVDVRIASEHRHQLNAPPNTSARIKNDSLVWKKPYVEVFNRSDYGGGLRPGTRIEGVDGWTEEKIWMASGQLGEGFDAALLKGQDSIDWLEEWATSGEGEELRAEMQTFLVSLEQAAAAKADRAREDMLAALSNGSKLLQEMSNQNSPQAAEVRNSLKTVLAQSESLSAEARAELERMLSEMERSPGQSTAADVDGEK